MQIRSAIARVAALSLVLALGLASCSSGEANDAPSTLAPPTVPAEPASTGLTVVANDLDTATAGALEEAAEKGHGEVSAPGAIMAVRTPEGTWTATIGSADLEGTRPMTVDMHQRIGSNTKTFTVTLLLQLVEQGALSMDDPIEVYVPGMPNPQATLGQLAAMRSGIPSYTLTDKFSDAFFAAPTEPWSPQQVVDLVKGQDPLFEPGADWYYSNTNLVLLGMVIEKVTGRPIDELMNESIIDPLGLTGTTFPTDASFLDPHPRGYTVQGQADRVPADATDWNPSWAFTAGAMISTVDDLLEYSRELVVGGTLLTPEMQAERFDSLQDMGPDFPPDHAYGWGLQRVNGWYGHVGELPGFNTFMYHHVAEDLTVIVMVNSDIKSGACTGDDVADTVPDGRTTGPCLDPAVHMADLLTTALGYPGSLTDPDPGAFASTTAG